MEPHDGVVHVLFSEDPFHDPFRDGNPRSGMAVWRIEALAGVVESPRRCGLGEFIEG